MQNSTNVFSLFILTRAPKRTQALVWMFLAVFLFQLKRLDS